MLDDASSRVSAVDLFFLDSARNTEEKNEKTDPLATQAAHELALMMLE
jgi:hypothetical protein